MTNNSFLYQLTNPRSNLFNSFLREHGQVDFKVCWYPSAGKDYRPLLYLSDQYKVYCKIGCSHEPKSPDFFILTDYNSHLEFRKGSILHQDSCSKITVLDSEKLMPINMRYSLDIVDFAQNRSYNNVTFIQALVESKQIGTFKVPLLYINAINEYFCMDFLIRYQAIISYIIHVRYGGGCGGGGRASGAWLNYVLELLKTEVYITDEQEDLQSGDEVFLEQFPKLKLQTVPKKTLLRTIPSENWSSHGDVNWYLMDR